MTYGSPPPARSDDSCQTSAQDEARDPLGDVTILVCQSCRLSSDPHLAPRPGSILAEQTLEAAKAAGISVRRVSCLGNCKRGLSAAILRDGSWSYVFGGLQPDSADDLIAGARLFAGSTDNLMPFRERPEALKRGLIARVPTF